MTTLNKALVQLGFDQNNDYVLGADKNGNASIWEWHSALPQPTQEAIDQAKIDWENGWNATQYQRDRAAEYPSIEALVVALWEGVVEERMAAVTKLETLRQAVKAKYPKG